LELSWACGPIGRNLLRISSAAILVAGAAACAPEPPPAEHTVARHAILIVIDTLRADRVGYMGADRATSPRVDQLARDGTSFLRAYANSPWTVPSTATILTSLYPSEHGAEVIGDVRNLAEMPPRQIHAAVRSVGEILQESRFRCGLFSANPYLFGRFKDGYDTAFVDRQSATTITDLALEYIASVQGDRFFVHIQYMDLHPPIEPPAPYFNLFPTPEAGPRGERHKEWAFSRGRDLSSDEFVEFRDNKLALYDGALRYIDDEIGRLMDTLESLGILEDTLIVVTSDHGEEFWDHAELEAFLGGDPRGYYGIGHGHTLFQELLRVPLLFFGPGASSGLTVDDPVSLLDLAPTMLGLLDVRIPEQMRGKNLQSVNGGGKMKTPISTPIYAESPAYGPSAWCLIEGGRKFIARDDGVRLLYDLVSDPRETHDLASDNPELGQEMQDRLDSFRSTLAPVGPTDSMNIDGRTEEQLRALGYVE